MTENLCAVEAINYAEVYKNCMLTFWSFYTLIQSIIEHIPSNILTLRIPLICPLLGLTQMQNLKKNCSFQTQLYL